MKAFALIAGLLCLAACSSKDEDIQPGRWSCDKLIQPVIDMSQEQEVKIIEITGAMEAGETTQNHLVCRGYAEWTRGGEQSIKFGARVSDGNKIIVEYEQELT